MPQKRDRPQGILNATICEMSQDIQNALGMLNSAKKREMRFVPTMQIWTKNEKRRNIGKLSNVLKM